jgi:hypothetical protein
MHLSLAPFVLAADLAPTSAAAAPPPLPAPERLLTSRALPTPRTDDAGGLRCSPHARLDLVDPVL